MSYSNIDVIKVNGKEIGVIKVPITLTDEQVAALKDKWKKMTQTDSIVMGDMRVEPKGKRLLKIGRFEVWLK